mgnify:CR=1 FL=1
MKNLVKYLAFLPLLLIQYSCEDTVTDATVNNGDVVGSWMMTGLTGVYTYTIDLPGSESGVTYEEGAKFGIKARWELAETMLPGHVESTDQWILELGVGDTALYTVAEYNLAAMQYAGFGLIGVFEDAPSAGADATYRMKGEYPGVFYNYSECASAGSTAPMTDQGLYTWNPSTTSHNFVIKRDPSIAGSQVLPPFDDGDITVSEPDSIGNSTLNIKFLDRDSHSDRYSEVKAAWDEGMHPDTYYGGNNLNSGGDRTYMAFPDSLAINAAGIIVGAYDGTEGTTKSDKGYIYSPTSDALAPFGGFYTWYAYVFGAESAAILKTLTDGGTDLNGDGAISMADVIAYMLANPTVQCFSGVLPGAPTYVDLVTAGGDLGYTITNDSGTDFPESAADADGGKMMFKVIPDCAAPVDVTIDFDATFDRCTNDNCVGDGYHVNPTWD